MRRAGSRAAAIDCEEAEEDQQLMNGAAAAPSMKESAGKHKALKARPYWLLMGANSAGAERSAPDQPWTRPPPPPQA